MFQLSIRILFNLLQIDFIELFHRSHFMYPWFITINSTQHIIYWSFIITLKIINDTWTLQMMRNYISIAFVWLWFIRFPKIYRLWLYLKIYNKMMFWLNLFLMKFVYNSWWDRLLFLIMIDKHQNFSVFSSYQGYYK